MRFTPIDHPSDVGIDVSGRSREEVFENAAFGMFSLMADLEKVEDRETFEINVKGDDPENLMINWLNELLYYSDAKSMSFKDFKVRKLEPGSLEATVAGEAIDPRRHSLFSGIKAATYNQLRVGKNHARIIFDV